MTFHRDIKNLGFKEDWHDDSLERRLLDMTIEAGYSFKEYHFDGVKGHFYVCHEARLAYHTKD